jgi:Flp pilus assembly protein TadG
VKGSKFYNRLCSEAGQSMTEFTLVLPALFFILFMIVQFGIVFNNYLTLTDAVRAGSRKGTVSRLAANPKGTTEQAVKDAAGGLDQGEILVDAQSSWQPGEPLIVTATYPYEVKILGKVIASGDLSSEIKERVE